MLDVSDGCSSVDSFKEFYLEYESSDKNISGFQGERMNSYWELCYSK